MTNKTTIMYEVRYDNLCGDICRQLFSSLENAAIFRDVLLNSTDVGVPLSITKKTVVEHVVDEVLWDE